MSVGPASEDALGGPESAFPLAARRIPVLLAFYPPQMDVASLLEQRAGDWELPAIPTECGRSGAELPA